MTHRKRNIIIITAASTALMLAVVFLSLGLTVWRPKTTVIKNPYYESLQTAKLLAGVV